MTARLGIVDKNGTARYRSADIQECRDFLYAAGLDCTIRGWLAPGYAGAIYFEGKENGGGWEAAYWRD